MKVNEIDKSLSEFDLNWKDVAQAAKKGIKGINLFKNLKKMTPDDIRQNAQDLAGNAINDKLDDYFSKRHRSNDRTNEPQPNKFMTPIDGSFLKR
jgi:hypothetical protein